MAWNPDHFVREQVAPLTFTSVCRMCGTIVSYHRSEQECVDHERHHFCLSMEEDATA